MFVCRSPALSTCPFSSLPSSFHPLPLLMTSPHLSPLPHPPSPVPLLLLLPLPPAMFLIGCRTPTLNSKKKNTICVLSWFRQKVDHFFEHATHATFIWWQIHKQTTAIGRRVAAIKLDARKINANGGEVAAINNESPTR